MIFSERDFSYFPHLAFRPTFHNKLIKPRKWTVYAHALMHSDSPLQHGHHRQFLTSLLIQYTQLPAVPPKSVTLICKTLAGNSVFTTRISALQ